MACLASTLMDLIDGDAAILGAEDAEDRLAGELINGRRIEADAAVADDDGADVFRFLADQSRVHAAHAPADGPHLLVLGDVIERLEVGDASFQVVSPFLGVEGAHQLVSDGGIVGGLAAVEIDGERDISFAGESVGVPLTQSVKPHHS